MTGGKYPLRTVDPKDRRRIGREDREAMLREARYRCYYCATLIKTTLEMRLDHKTPLARGGEDKRANIAISCVRCDYIKGTLTEKEFRAANLGRGRERPFGSKKAPKPSMETLRQRMRTMERWNPNSRKLDILRRALRGERVDVSAYPEYVNPRQRKDDIRIHLRYYAKHYPIFKFENGIFWKEGEM